jgi:hypothetical protein
MLRLESSDERMESFPGDTIASRPNLQRWNTGLIKLQPYP